MKLIYKKSVKGRRGIRLPKSDVPYAPVLDDKYRRSVDAILPEVSELDTVRHFTDLSKLNFSVDGNFYPLGSCTMKYNPKVLEAADSLEGFNALHPFIPILSPEKEMASGALEVLSGLQEMLSEITGMDMFTLQPMAGAQGELAGILIIKAYHRKKNSDKKFIIVPDASHGTNPASAAIAGYEVITIPTDPSGQMDMDEFKKNLNGKTAAVIMTCPNTLGIFNTRIKEICELAHSFDALMYYDGANMNAIMGKTRPGDMGFDIAHVNLHKTFGTPHGGGGPGAGPVGVKNSLGSFLPQPVIIKDSAGRITLSNDNPDSIGRIAPFYGNFGVLLKAFAYILLMGKDGLADITEKAVLNANYIMEKLKGHYELPYDRRCMHECVFSALKQAENGIRALDIAKYLIDKGIHPPTIYFPLIVKEAMMIEPTETESKQTLDGFIENMIEAARLALEDPAKLHDTPVTGPVGRLDEVLAARNLDVSYKELL
ncbi:aminomethyl-transferring glycine dehydrogenase subunit GcvPB [Elusimicrobiota bacterium]